ncbi:MAG: tyrosine-type recombinase/integrase [Clostridiales bacterium]|jgi:site-specific recombinase XerD|nr:tyrosine-type recombinase/integrase [Clostridiales bacterium]
MPEYHEQVKNRTTLKLRERMRGLPFFMTDFFRGVSDVTSVLTRIGYAYDLRIFFQFLIEEYAEFGDKEISDMEISDLNAITSDHIEAFMEYLDYYVRNDDTKTLILQNDENGKSRKLAAVRTMFAYFFKKRLINSNPAVLVDFPKRHAKNIIRLEINEIAKLLDEVESGEHLTDRQKKYHKYTKSRDLAIISLLLGTGTRVSECVGIDRGHIDFDLNAVKITRKGGSESILYFGSEIEEALKGYLPHRNEIQAADAEDNDALFLSMQNRRISVRAVEKLVKKYARLVTTLKKISPHKLRSTYGTQLYRETGDIYLVADVLGHADVNTTRKHYTEMDENRRKDAAKFVKLREPPDPDGTPKNR